MGKMVGIAEFKAHCTRLLRELEQDGVPITVTNRGKPVAVLRSPQDQAEADGQSAIGFLRSDQYRCDWDPEEPAGDPDDWEALR